jgi:hypothetical protein
MFPSANIYIMFFAWLPTGEVMNHWKIAAAFLVFITDNRWHIQAKALYDAKHHLFGKIIAFQLDEDSSGPGATFIKAITSAMKSWLSWILPVTLKLEHAMLFQKR